METFDLTKEMQWRHYVCSHPMARDIIGNGIIKSEGRFCVEPEPNCIQLGLPGPYGHCRFDFVALQGGGRAARSHPGNKRDADIVTGQYSDWLLTPSA